MIESRGRHRVTFVETRTASVENCVFQTLFQSSLRAPLFALHSTQIEQIQSCVQRSQNADRIVLGNEIAPSTWVILDADTQHVHTLSSVIGFICLNEDSVWIESDNSAPIFWAR